MFCFVIGGLQPTTQVMLQCSKNDIFYCNRETSHTECCKQIASCGVWKSKNCLFFYFGRITKVMINFNKTRKQVITGFDNRDFPLIWSRGQRSLISKQLTEVQISLSHPSLPLRPTQGLHICWVCCVNRPVLPTGWASSQWDKERGRSLEWGEEGCGGVCRNVSKTWEARIELGLHLDGTMSKCSPSRFLILPGYTFVHTCSKHLNFTRLTG